jgi:hypothetical protein
MKHIQFFDFPGKYLLLLGIFIFQNALLAQDATIVFQGIVKNASGAPVADGEYTFNFTLWSSLDGTANTDKLLKIGATDYNTPSNQWSETVTLQVRGGVYSHYLGSVTPLNPQNFLEPVFLNINFQGRDLVPRAGLGYSPYALFVSKAYQAVCSGAVGDIKYSLLPPDKFKDVNGDCWVPLDGRTLSSTDALYQQGVMTLPNAGGTFIRTQDFAASTFTESSWTSVAYGNDLWVAVATSGTRRVMTSPNGINWTNRFSAANNNWTSVAYGNGLFVAVSNSGSGNRVMTSPDGITWTSRTSAADNNWISVTYGNGLFVAVAVSGTGNRVMTSPDGINWTIRTSAANNSWVSVTYGNGLFVAVSDSGTGGRVMTSPDGISWTIRTTPVNNSWFSVAYGNGLFVAVAYSGTGNRVMTSPNGITWTSRTSAADNNWSSVAYGNGLFAAVARSGTGNRVMTSPDGITWTSRTSAADNSWNSVAYGNGRFVAASTVGLGNRVMTSTNGVSWTTSQTPDERWNTLNSSNADPERSAATAPGTLQNSDFQAHTHTTTSAGAHQHYFDRRAAGTNESDGTNGDNSGKGTNNSPVGSSTTSTDGTHTHTMNANSDGGNANETRPVNLNLWVYIRIK